MSCKIVLDAPGILSPGSTMYGRVVCTFSSNTYIKEIRCKLRGTETTSVRHGKSTYVGSNRFLDLRLRLLGEKKDAFVLGEMAKVNVEITNWSNTNVEEFILTLNRVTMYHCELEGARHTKEQELIGFQNATGVGAHGKRTYTVNFQIPTTISVYNLTPCQLIKQIFILRAEAVLPICHQNLTVDAEIKLGHIGLHDNNSTQETNLGFEDLEGANYDTPPRYSALF
ncbi:uncharacterized protein [Diabrotica undecimpunctata]|uniref:uncharacterized protein isoform X2 n=1 Tax=Diabrotica undecimpunctata TaxID=50387 RepID=UPI003B63B5C1